METHPQSLPQGETWTPEVTGKISRCSQAAQGLQGMKPAETQGLPGLPLHLGLEGGEGEVATPRV